MNGSSAVATGVACVAGPRCCRTPGLPCLHEPNTGLVNGIVWPIEGELSDNDERECRARDVYPFPETLETKKHPLFFSKESEKFFSWHITLA